MCSQAEHTVAHEALSANVEKPTIGVCLGAFRVPVAETVNATEYVTVQVKSNGMGWLLKAMNISVRYWERCYNKIPNNILTALGDAIGKAQGKRQRESRKVDSKGWNTETLTIIVRGYELEVLNCRWPVAMAVTKVQTKPGDNVAWLMQQIIADITRGTQLQSSDSAEQDTQTPDATYADMATAASPPGASAASPHGKKRPHYGGRTSRDCGAVIDAGLEDRRPT